MLYVDLKYIALAGSHLRNFKKKKDGLFNCSCPICGDSEKKKSKARGYFYQKGQSMFFKCHNCSTGLGISNFLKELFPNYYDQYILEKYKSGVHNTKTSSVPVQEVVEDSSVIFSTKLATCVTELHDAHYAKQYVLNRKIPESQLHRIYFTEDFASFVDELFPGKYANLSKNEPRLILPFFDTHNKVIGLQGRSFTPEKALRYITIRSSDDVDLIYGLDKLDSNKTVFVVEGPIDSLFLPNCLAAANSDLMSVLEKIKLSLDAILVYDNEPRNREIVKLMETAIGKNKKLCIWPPGIEQKDINDMILSGKSPEDIAKLILSRSFSGLQAQLEFCKWKKI